LFVLCCTEATQAYSAVQRIARFLERDVRENFENLRNESSGNEACARNTWDTVEDYASSQVQKGASESFSAVQQIGNFLERDGQGNDRYPRDDDNACNFTKKVEEIAPLQLKDAAFYIGAAQASCKSTEKRDEVTPAFSVSRFDVTVQRGEVLAICGPVGAGKSLLVNGIIGEAPSLPESIVATKGSIAFVPQSPFILNCSLKENVLFGREFKQDLYSRVLDACCLRTDIEHLGSMKDLTEIGERGVTLSGGKFQVKVSPGLFITRANAKFFVLIRSKTTGIGE